MEMKTYKFPLGNAGKDVGVEVLTAKALNFQSKLGNVSISSVFKSFFLSDKTNISL